MQTTKQMVFKNKTKKLLTEIWKFRALYLMALPAIIFFIIFVYSPMYGVIVAFKDLYIKKGILGSPWVGLFWFNKLFSDPEFWNVFKNTLILNFYRLVFTFPAPIILALMINEVRVVSMKRTIQTIVYLPHFVSWVVIFGIIQTILGDTGLMNNLFVTLGLNKVNYLSNPSNFRSLLILTGLWKNIGFSSIIYLAAIAGISPEYYEAAIIDGATRFKQILFITLPLMATTVAMLFILNIGSMMNSDFDQVYNLLNPMVRSVGDIMDTYLMRVGIIGGSYEIGTAVGLFKNVINLFLLIIANQITKKLTGNGIY